MPKCPRALEALWQEYANGPGGSLPARELAARERGRAKRMYSKRKIIWGATQRMLGRGWALENAARSTKHAHGSKPASQLIEAMRKGEAQGGGRRLR